MVVIGWLPIGAISGKMISLLAYIMHVLVIPIIVCFEGGNDLTAHKLVCALIMNVGLAEAIEAKKKLHAVGWILNIINDCV